MSAPATPPVPDAVEEIGRRIRWPLLPALVFLGIMAALAIVAVLTIRKDPPFLTGLPDDPDARAAAALMAGRPVPLVDLRFQSSLIGPGRARGEADAATLQRVDSLLVRALARRRWDPRLGAARATVALLRGDVKVAERAFRAVADRTPGYGEARLGLGVALALRAARAGDDVLEARRLDLQALGQFAAVREGDPAYAAARANRIAWLERAGRGVEARKLRDAAMER